MLDDARNGRYGLKVVDDPLPGDLVLFNWDGGEYDHVGLFEQWVPGSSSFYAIEGNTSSSNNSNGGEVMRRQRALGAGYSVAFVRVAEP
jgi:hypothetical protein